MPDKRPFSAFGIHKKAGIIVIGGGEITHISIASIKDTQGQQNAQVLFYGNDNEVISPNPIDIAVFDTKLNPLEFSYTPLQTPGSLEIPVSIALDNSGSMDRYMSTVIKATQEFMNKLPVFTRCNVFTFADDIQYLTPVFLNQKTTCPASSYLLNKHIKADGMTALYKAINTGFTSMHSSDKQDFPNITVVVTDGVNTVNHGVTLADLKVSKPKLNSKLFVFWVGKVEKSYLQGLADMELVSTQNLEQELESFFHSLGVSLSGLQTLHIKK